MMIRTSLANRTDRSRKKCRPVSLCCLRAGLVGIVLLLLPIPAHPESDPAVPQMPVRGELVMLKRELIVVKSDKGTNILIPIGKDTEFDTTLKVGDQVEVVVIPENHVNSVRKLTPEPLP